MHASGIDACKWLSVSERGEEQRRGEELLQKSTIRGELIRNKTGAKGLREGKHCLVSLPCLTALSHSCETRQERKRT